MVLLTMTPGIVRALARAEAASPDGYAELHRANDPDLAGAQPGNPVSHSQLIALAKLLKQASIPHDEKDTPSTLSSLLSTSTLYTPPPAPPTPKSPQYIALMARLRADQELQSYIRMLQPPSTSADYSLGASAPADSIDDITYDEVHRQIILIINILISVVCVAMFIWVAARHWSVGKRLGLSLGGSLGVAVAEVAVYGGYVRKVQEAKRVERKKPEIKEIVRSWVVGRGGEEEKKEKEGEDGMRFRKGKHR